MPTLFYKFGYRFYFVSYDCNEPLHVHVTDGKRKIAKYWLLKYERILLSSQSGFTNSDRIKIERAIADNFKLIKETFDEYCKKNKK